MLIIESDNVATRDVCVRMINHKFLVVRKTSPYLSIDGRVRAVSCSGPYYIRHTI